MFRTPGNRPDRAELSTGFHGESALSVKLRRCTPTPIRGAASPNSSKGSSAGASCSPWASPAPRRAGTSRTDAGDYCCPACTPPSPGPVGELAAVWAAVLGPGSGAAASHATALWLGGVIDDRPDVIHISIPAERRVRSHPGVRIHRTRDFSDSVHPAALPPRSRVECAVLDVSEPPDPWSLSTSCCGRFNVG